MTSEAIILSGQLPAESLRSGSLTAVICAIACTCSPCATESVTFIVISRLFFRKTGSLAVS